MTELTPGERADVVRDAAVGAGLLLDTVQRIKTEAVRVALSEVTREWSRSRHDDAVAERDVLRARIEALCGKWEGDRLKTVVEVVGAAYLLRAALEATS